MSQHWEKGGLLIAAPPPMAWASSHAALPCADVLDDGTFDLYYSPRDQGGRAHVAVARVAAPEAGKLEVVEYCPEAVLEPGPLGSFDESGATVSCVVRHADRTFLYYTGWTLGVTVPFYFYAGLAVRQPGQTAFVRHSAGPLLERNAVDPYLTASPWVLREDSGLWRMWYVSCCDWRMRDGAPQHRYHIRYAESDDGLDWRREGRVSIDFADDEEYAMGRPCVVRDEDRYRMWFSARGDHYRLAYAESPDGITWTRADAEAALSTSRTGWDAEMIAYPAVVDRSQDRYLLYNGNGYGRSGIGYALATDTESAA